MNEYAVMPISDYKDACDAIREKSSITDAIRSGDLKALISAIEGNGGGVSGEFEVDTSTNLHDTSTDTPNVYINGSKGEAAYNGWSATDYIPLTVGQYYALKATSIDGRYCAFYNENKDWVNNLAGTGSSFTTSAMNCYVIFKATSPFVRFSATTSPITNLKLYNVLITSKSGLKLATGSFTQVSTSMSTPTITHNLGTKKIVCLVWIPNDVTFVPKAGYQIFAASFVNAPAFFGDSIQVDCTGYNSGKFSEVSTVKYNSLSFGAVGRSPWTTQSNFTAPNVSAGAISGSTITDDTLIFKSSSSFLGGYTYNYLILGM